MEVAVMKPFFTNKLRNLIPFVLLFVLLLFAVVISVQAGVTNGLQEPPTSTPVPPSPAIKSGSDAGSIYLPVVSDAQPTNTPEPPPPGSGSEFFISPSGDDSHSGASPNQAWATFKHAWTVLKPGNILTMLDGVYKKTTIDPPPIGQPGNPITIRAQNDGKAIIDGEFVRQPVWTRYGKQNYYLVIEGIVARNSLKHVFRLNGNHTTLRRVSGYDAHTDENAHVFTITGANNLVEDCAASGTGRKMVLIYQGDHNTVRRCFTDWREWDGRNWGSCWPWGEGLEIYGGSNNIIENSIAYGHTSRAGVSLLAQEPQKANENKILGTMSILSGMKEDSTPMVWGITRPQPTQYTCMQKFDQWPNLLAGIRVGGSGILHDNLLQDVFSWGSARYGLTFHVSGPNPSIINNHVNRATVFNNGLDNISRWGGVGSGASQEGLAAFESIENSTIENIWMGGSSFVTQEGEGARLTNRYVDGVMTNEPLWPWPMEERIQSEQGISVTEIMTGIISQNP